MRHANIGPTVRRADLPLPQATILDLQHVTRKLLLIFRPAEGRRLSWPQHTVSYQLAEGLQMTRGEIRAHNLKVTSLILFR